MDITDVIDTLCLLDGVKSAAGTMRDRLLNVDIDQLDKFCDAEETQLAWRTTKIPDKL